MYHRIKLWIVRKKIKRDPAIGIEESEGIHVYKEGGYSIRYRLGNKPDEPKSIEWISQKARIGQSPSMLAGAKEYVFRFWQYQGWLIILRPRIFLPLAVGIFVFYFGIVETEKAKISRFRWVISSTTGISPDQIQYIGNGWLAVDAQRKTSSGKVEGRIKYSFNPARWLFSPEAGYITLWQGKHYGYAKYPVVYNNSGDIWINKENQWKHGNISGSHIKWDTSQGIGAGLVNRGKISGHEISTEDKKLFINDTK